MDVHHVASAIVANVTAARERFSNDLGGLMPVGRSALISLLTSVLVLGSITSLSAGAVADGEDAAATSASVADVTAADDASTAEQVAETYDHDVVVSSSLTPTVSVVAKSDGTLERTEDTVPVRTEQNGTWVPVDTSLEADGSWLTPSATDTHVRFSRGGSDTLAQVQTDSGAWVSESWPDGGALPVPEVDGSTALYADVVPNVDMQLTATPSGMSEVLVVKTAEAAASPELRQVELQLHGAKVTATQTGSTATTADGSSLSAASPTWWDSSHGGDSDGPGGDGSPRPVTHTTTSDGVALDVAAITTQASTYPLYVDPDWSAGDSAFWFDDAAYPGQSYLNGQYSAGYQSVGYAQQDGSTYVSRAFWQFSTAGLAGKHIVDAHFNAVATYSCGNATVQAWRYGVVGAGQNWNWDQANQGQWRDHISDASIPAVSGCAMAGKAVGWDVARAVDAVNGGTLQIGLRSAAEGSISRKHFNQHASLTVLYNTPPSTPSGATIASPQRSCGTSTSNAAGVNNKAQDLVLSSKTSDADNDLTHITYQVMRATDPDTAVFTKASADARGGVQTAEVPAGTLSDGNYMFRGKTWDKTEWSGWSSWCYFTSDSHAPAAPAVSVPTGAHTVGTNMTVTVTATDSDVRGFSYWVAPDGSGTLTQPLSDAVSTSTGYASCAFSDGLVTYVCSNSSHAATLTFAPVDTANTLWVWAIDRAGNVSAPGKIGGSNDVDGGAAIIADPDPRVGSTAGAAGHVWTGISDGSVTGAGTSASPTVIADDRVSGGTGAAASLPLTVDPSVGTAQPDTFPADVKYPSTIMHLGDLVRINRFNGPDGHRATIAGGAPSGAHFEITLGELVSSGADQPAGTNKIWSCRADWGDRTLIGSACPTGTDTSQLLGYGWASADDIPAGATPRHVWSCWTGTEYFDSNQSTCEGKTVKNDLGYFALVGATHTDAAPIDTTKSYTVSAFLHPTSGAAGHYNTAVSIDGDTTSAFYLQYGGDNFRFCVKQQTEAAKTDCASPTGTDYSSAPTKDAWYFVTGVWDAANQEARIYINASPGGSHSVAHLLGTGETAVSGGLRVGGALSSGGPSDAFDGDIADVSITQGVATLTQLGLLMKQGTYAYADGN